MLSATFLVFLGSQSALVGADDAKCCVGRCTDQNMEKYYSIALGPDPNSKRVLGKHCGESCMDPADFKKYHLFEPGLTLANGTYTPCADMGFTNYWETETHGAGPITATVDLYNTPEDLKGDDAKCCVGRCTDPIMQKYYSIAFGPDPNSKRVLGKHCGESCLDPADFKKYHLFEPGLTPADGTYTPCADMGFTNYWETETHGAGPITATVDLYNKPID
jgi:hypothetical protein